VLLLSFQRSNDGKARNVFASKWLHNSILTAIGAKKTLRVSCETSLLTQQQVRITGQWADKKTFIILCEFVFFLAF